MAPFWALQLDAEPAGRVLAHLRRADPHRGHRRGALPHRPHARLAAHHGGDRARSRSALLTMAAGLQHRAVLRARASPSAAWSSSSGCCGGATTGPIGSWLVGGGIAFTILARFDSVVLVLPVVLVVPLFVSVDPARAPRWRRWVPGLRRADRARASGGRSITTTSGSVRLSTVATSDDLFTFGFFDGLGRQLLSPGKGFFWYDLILIAALPGFVWLWKRDRGTDDPRSSGLQPRARPVLRCPGTRPTASSRGARASSCRACALLAIPLGETIEWAHRRDKVVRADRVRCARGAGARECGGDRGVAVAAVRLQLDGRQRDPELPGAPRRAGGPHAPRRASTRCTTPGRTARSTSGCGHSRTREPGRRSRCAGGAVDPSPTGVIAVVLAGGCSRARRGVRPESTWGGRWKHPHHVSRQLVRFAFGVHRGGPAPDPSDGGAAVWIPPGGPSSYRPSGRAPPGSQNVDHALYGPPPFSGTEDYTGQPGALERKTRGATRPRSQILASRAVIATR